MKFHWQKALINNPKLLFAYRARGYLKELNVEKKEACMNNKKADRYEDKGVKQRMRLDC